MKEALAEERRGRAAVTGSGSQLLRITLGDNTNAAGDNANAAGTTQERVDEGRWERENAALRAMVKSLEQQIVELQFEATRERVGRG